MDAGVKMLAQRRERPARERVAEIARILGERGGESGLALGVDAPRTSRTLVDLEPLEAEAEVVVDPALHGRVMQPEELGDLGRFPAVRRPEDRPALVSVLGVLGASQGALDAAAMGLPKGRYEERMHAESPARGRRRLPQRIGRAPQSLQSIRATT